MGFFKIKIRCKLDPQITEEQKNLCSFRVNLRQEFIRICAILGRMLQIVEQNFHAKYRKITWDSFGCF